MNYEIERSGTIVWSTGIAKAGKSTVAHKLRQRMICQGERPILIDDDSIRQVLGVEIDHRTESRRRLAFVYARLCKLLAEQGYDVICATISLFHDVQAWNRANQPNYIEVLLEVPVSIARRRDTEGIYTERPDDIVGVGQMAEYPTNPDIAINNFGSTTACDAERHIFNSYKASVDRRKEK